MAATPPPSRASARQAQPAVEDAPMGSASNQLSTSNTDSASAALDTRPVAATDTTRRSRNAFRAPIQPADTWKRPDDIGTWASELGKAERPSDTILRRIEDALFLIPPACCDMARFAMHEADNSMAYSRHARHVIERVMKADKDFGSDQWEGVRTRESTSRNRLEREADLPKSAERIAKTVTMERQAISALFRFLDSRLMTPSQRRAADTAERPESAAAPPPRVLPPDGWIVRDHALPGVMGEPGPRLFPFEEAPRRVAASVPWRGVPAGSIGSTRRPPLASRAGTVGPVIPADTSLASRFDPVRPYKRKGPGPDDIAAPPAQVRRMSTATTPTAAPNAQALRLAAMNHGAMKRDVDAFIGTGRTDGGHLAKWFADTFEDGFGASHGTSWDQLKITPEQDQMRLIETITARIPPESRVDMQREAMALCRSLAPAEPATRMFDPITEAWTVPGHPRASRPA